MTLPARSLGETRRESLPGARDDRLYYARVWEDPLLEIEALQPSAADTIVVVGSGGCTALSLLASGAGQVVAVDLNRTQNHVSELKLAAICHLSNEEAIGFLGGADPPRVGRWTTYVSLRHVLTPPARRYWDSHARSIERGIITSGVSERFMAAVALAIRMFVHPAARIQRLLASRTLTEQQDLYRQEWNTWRWRALYRVLLGRWVFRRAYDPAFFEHVENPSFPEHFRRLAEHGLTQLPVADNYFLHLALTGRFSASALPPYLTERGMAAIRHAGNRLLLFDGGYTEYLHTLPSGSVSGFCLSNICEWLDAAGTEALFAEIVRTAAPGATLCFRNFVGWTEVPEAWRRAVVEDRARGDAMIRRDRSLVNRRFAVCRIVGAEP